MRNVLGAVMALACGCSFAMQAPPQDPRADEEPTCSESFVRPGFDGAMAVANAIAGALAVRSLAVHGCGAVDPTYGYATSPGCSTYALYLGGAVAATGVFVASAAVGTSRADRCKRANDEYDHTHDHRTKERYRGEAGTGVAMGILVAAIVDGLLIVTFPNH